MGITNGDNSKDEKCPIEIKRLVLIDYENFIGSIAQIFQEGNSLPKLTYELCGEFFKFLAQELEIQSTGTSNIKTEIHCYYRSIPEQKRMKDSKSQMYYGFIDYFQVLKDQLEEAGISFIPRATGSLSVDSEIITDIARILLQSKYEIEEIVLISGDGDFARIIQMAIDQGKRVIVIAGDGSCSGLIKVVAEVLSLDYLFKKTYDLSKRTKETDETEKIKRVGGETEQREGSAKV